MMRVVIDTNVWLSALLWGGQPERIAQLAELKQIQAISSEEILTEFTDILEKAKFHKRLNQLGFTADEVTIIAKRLMTFVVIEELLVPELRDPKDQMILATAIAGNAECKGDPRCQEDRIVSYLMINARKNYTLNPHV